MTKNSQFGAVFCPKIQAYAPENKLEKSTYQHIWLVLTHRGLYGAYIPVRIGVYTAHI